MIRPDVSGGARERDAAAYATLVRYVVAPAPAGTERYCPACFEVHGEVCPELTLTGGA